MSAKVYILLNVPNGNPTQVVETVMSQKGVIAADILEGPPDIILVIKASDRKKLAYATNQAIASVEDMIENIRLLPAIMNSDTSTAERRRRVKEVAHTIGGTVKDKYRGHRAIWWESSSRMHGIS